MNAAGRLVTPGLVDCHTHMIFAGHRADEFQRRLRGEDYAAIAEAGGGIRSTVRATADERDETLEKNLANRLERWRANGCTTVEVKSGYGLTPSAELRLLELMRGAGQRVPARLHRTALVLHEMQGFTTEEIAGMQGVSPSTVRSRLTRGRERLSKYYVRRGWVDDAVGGSRGNLASVHLEGSR